MNVEDVTVHRRYYARGHVTQQTCKQEEFDVVTVDCRTNVFGKRGLIRTDHTRHAELLRYVDNSKVVFRRDNEAYLKARGVRSRIFTERTGIRTAPRTNDGRTNTW